MEQQALHCRQTIQNLLDISTQKEHHPEPTDINQVIEAAWSRFTAENDDTSKIEVIPGLDPNLPLASVDSRQIELALFHLIQNACRSMPEGGVLRITSRVVGNEIQVIVSDSGAGITKDELHHIFDPFDQPHRPGYGMDLSITRAIIERDNGMIEVDSEPGQGTTFTIRLPSAA
jgi:signal transduction histidine kinase